MELNIGRATIENIDFFGHLCYFYRNENQKRTNCKIEKDED